MSGTVQWYDEVVMLTAEFLQAALSSVGAPPYLPTYVSLHAFLMSLAATLFALCAVTVAGFTCRRVAGSLSSFIQRLLT